MTGKLLKKLIRPPYRVIIILDLAAIPFVVIALGVLTETNPVSYAAYLLSAYALTVTVINFRDMIRYAKKLVKGDDLKIVVGFRRLMHKNKYTARWLDDRAFRAEVSLYTGLAVNLFYAAFKTVTGYMYSSVWLYSLGAYYFVFGAIRFVLMRNVRKNYRESDEHSKKIRECRTYRNCGILMFLMNAVMAGLAAQMVIMNEGDTLPKIVVIMSAAYTFYYFILAVYNMVSFRKADNMILSAAKNLTFAGALMSMYSLQTAMLTAFNENNGTDYRQLMNGITGAGVTLIVLLVSVIMIIKGSARMRKLQN